MGDIQYTKWILGLANQVRRSFNLLTGNNGAQTRILYFILENYADGELYQKDIQKALNIKGASLSALLKKLEKQEMIERIHKEDDVRLKRILPTSQTIMLKEELEMKINMIEGKLIEGIEKEELETYFRVTQKMLLNMSD